MRNPNHTFLRLTLHQEEIFYPKIQSILLKQRKQFVSDLNTHGEQTARLNLQSQPLDPLIPELLTKLYKTCGLMGARLQHSELLRVEQKGFGRNERWQSEVINFLRQYLLEISGHLQDTSREDIVRILEQGINEQLPLQDIIDKLTSADLLEARARLIARTEINRATNVGHSIAAKETPYEVNKQWISSNDHRTRHSHQKANKQIVDEQGTFKVQVYKGDKPTGQFDDMLFPGDHTAHASNTINCRCRVIYIPKRDSQGNLIMRERTQATIIPLRPIQQIPVEQIAAILKANATVTVK